MANDIKVKNEPARDPHSRPTETEVKHIGNTTGASTSPEDLSKIVANAVAEALKVAIPAAAVGINQANAEAQSRTREAQVREVMRRTKRCAICGQPETACGGPFKKDAAGNDIIEKNEDGTPKYAPTLNHVKAYVGPADTNLFKWFRGFFVNGVCYLSNRPGDKVWIPIKSDILTGVNAWEQNEKDLMQKRTAEGQGAGSIGPGGQVTNRGNQQAIGWR